MASLKTIAAALKLIDTKKDKLKKAYDELFQCQTNLSHSSLSHSLSWSDIDSHFTSLQNSLTHRFGLLQSLESAQPQEQQDNPSSSAPSQARVDPVPALGHSDNSPDAQEPQLVKVQVSSSLKSEAPTQEQVDSALTATDLAVSKKVPLCSSNPQTQNRSVPVLKQKRPIQDRDNSVVSVKQELIALCEKRDAKGLIKYISAYDAREIIRVELSEAFRAALDPAAMVLDAMQGFFKGNAPIKGDKDAELSGMRRSCVMLLEVLINMGVNVNDEVREKAKKLALEGKSNAQFHDKNSMEALGFLLFLVAYKLENEFDKGDLVDFFVVVARFRQGIQLCRDIGLGDKIHDFIQKLIDRGKLIWAVKFISELGLSDKYPPVPLLKAYLEQSTQAAKEACKDGKNPNKSQNQATSREINACKAVIRTIKEYKLQSEYPLESLEKHIELLKEKVDKSLQQQQQKPEQQQQEPKGQEKEPKQQQQEAQPQSKNKKQHKQQQKQQSGNKRRRNTAHGGPTAVPEFQRRPNIAPPLNLPAVSYGFLGGAATIPYTGYDLLAAPMDFPGNSNPSVPSLYSESLVPSAYHDMSIAYGGYGLPPQYHSSYHPQ